LDFQFSDLALTVSIFLKVLAVGKRASLDVPGGQR
jgi:hypothetical protein